MLASCAPRGIAAFREGRVQDAETSLHSVLRASPNHTEAHFVMGMLLQAKLKNDSEILRDLCPMVLQMIGAAVPV